MYFEKKLYKILNEADDVLDKMIKYKDADGNEKEATVGGILKKGKDHPAHDDAQKTYDASKGDGGEEAPKKVAKIDTNPFDDEPAAGNKPAGDKPKEYKSPQAGIRAEKDKLGSLLQQRQENPEDEQAYDELFDTLQDIFDKFDDQMATNIMEVPPEDLGDPDDFIEGLMDAANDKFYEDPDKNYDDTEPADEPKAASKKSVANDEINDFIGTIADAGERGAGFSDERVRRSVTRDLQQVKDKGGSIEDIAAELKKQAEYMNPEDFELADQAAEKIFGEKIPHGISNDEIGTALESKQPFKENYNRLFKGRDVL